MSYTQECCFFETGIMIGCSNSDSVYSGEHLEVLTNDSTKENIKSAFKDNSKSMVNQITLSGGENFSERFFSGRSRISHMRTLKTRNFGPEAF